MNLQQNRPTVALFGEAEKGEFQTAYLCRSISQLLDCFGNPPPDSRGIYYAVQVLLFHYNLIFFRVREEGFSSQDYLLGIHLLESQNQIRPVSAVCLPGVGNSEIIEALEPLCLEHHSLIIINESDFYDYLTTSKRS